MNIRYLHIISLFFGLFIVSLSSNVDAACKPESSSCVYSPLALIAPDSTCSVFNGSISPASFILFPFLSDCLKKILGDFSVLFSAVISTNFNVTGSISCSPLASLIVGSVLSSESATLSAGGDINLNCYITGPGIDKKLISLFSEQDINVGYSYSAATPCFFSKIEAGGVVSVSASLQANCPYINLVHGKSVDLTIGSLGTSVSSEASLESTSGNIDVNFNGKLFLSKVKAIGGGIHFNCSASVQTETGISIKGGLETSGSASIDSSINLFGELQSTVVTITEYIKSSKAIVLKELSKVTIGSEVKTDAGDFNITNVSEITISGSVVVNGDLVIVWDTTIKCGEIVIKGDLTVNGDIIFNSKVSGFMKSYCPITVKVEGNFQHTGTVERSGEAQMSVKGSPVAIENKTPGEQGAIAGIVIGCIAVVSLSVFAVYRFKSSKNSHQQLP